MPAYPGLQKESTSCSKDTPLKLSIFQGYLPQDYPPHNDLDFYPFFLYFMEKEVNGNLVKSSKGDVVPAALMEKTGILRFQTALTSWPRLFTQFSNIVSGIIPPDSINR